MASFDRMDLQSGGEGMMRTLENTVSFGFLDNMLVTSSADRTEFSLNFPSINFKSQWISRTKDFLILLNGNNEPIILSKQTMQVWDTFISWKDIGMVIYGEDFVNNRIIIFTRELDNRVYWIFDIKNREKIFESKTPVGFLHASDFVYTSGKDKNLDVYSLKDRSKKSVQLPKSILDVRLQTIGIDGDNLWLYLTNDELAKINIFSGEYSKISLQKELPKLNIDYLYVGFGDKTNPYRFHLDTKHNRIITFANRFYLEIPLTDGPIKVVDLDTISRLKIRICKSRWHTEKQRLFFIGNTSGFDNYFGIFDTQSHRILDLGKIEEKNGFFGHPPFYGSEGYAALSTKNVLYFKNLENDN